MKERLTDQTFKIPWTVGFQNLSAFLRYWERGIGQQAIRGELSPTLKCQIQRTYNDLIESMYKVKLTADKVMLHFGLEVDKRDFYDNDLKRKLFK